MNDSFLNEDFFQHFDVAAFNRQCPFPWANPVGLLTPSAFMRLLEDFPSLEMFEDHQGVERKGIMRPHDRRYLQLDGSVYRQGRRGPGIVQVEQLPPSWRHFIDELTSGPLYRELLRRAFGTGAFQFYFSWHVGSLGSEVCPHVDAQRKLGTHIFYFNTEQDWDPSWGGSTLILDDYPAELEQPDFQDFRRVERTESLDNHSLLFKNRPGAWHGVERLTCPEGVQRRLFNVVMTHPFHRHLLRKAGAVFGRHLC